MERLLKKHFWKALLTLLVAILAICIIMFFHIPLEVIISIVILITGLLIADNRLQFNNKETTDE